MMSFPRASLAIGFFASTVVGCDRGDYFGPVERSLRTVLFGWDMWQTPGVRPYARPMPLPPPGSVSISGRRDFKGFVARFASLDSQVKAVRAKAAYRHYCQHCHGEHGDGRTLVGESFSPAPPDFRTSGTCDQDPADLFAMATDGTGC